MQAIHPEKNRPLRNGDKVEIVGEDHLCRGMIGTYRGPAPNRWGAKCEIELETEGGRITFATADEIRALPVRVPSDVP